MRISLKQLKKCSVETTSGIVLGHVVDVEMETEGQTVMNYHVRRFPVGGDGYIISRNQVVRFEEKKLIVDDGVGKEIIAPKVTAVPAGPEVAAMRE